MDFMRVPCIVFTFFGIHILLDLCILALSHSGESVVVGISQPAFFHYRQLGEDDFIIGEITYYPNSKILVKIE